jgi:hypothetical protein
MPQGSIKCQDYCHYPQACNQKKWAGLAGKSKLAQ